MSQFIRLRRVQTPDGLGGMRVKWTAGENFQAVVSEKRGRRIRPGGLTASRARLVLAHLPGIRLMPGDVVQRVCDAAQWQVLTDSADMTMPRADGSGCAQVSVERVVIAP